MGLERVMRAGTLKGCALGQEVLAGPRVLPGAGHLHHRRNHEKAGRLSTVTVPPLPTRLVTTLTPPLIMFYQSHLPTQNVSTLQSTT